MDDDRVICEICMEKYDKQNHIPKKVQCCNKVFCLPCLEAIYRRNKNSILCPICRKITKTKPNNLETDNTVFDVFLTCLKCNNQIIKNEINISFDSHELCCIHCGKNNLLLSNFLEYVEVDLGDFLKECPNTNLKKVLEQNIKLKLTEFFEPLIEELKNEIINKLIKEILQKFKYDIENDYNKYLNYVNELKNIYGSMSSFMFDINQKGNLNKLQNDIKYYNEHFEEIKCEKTKVDNITNVINKSGLFSLKQNITLPEIKNFFINVFETFTSDHKTWDGVTGINYFDSQTLQLSNNVNQLQIENIELKEEITKLRQNPPSNNIIFPSYSSQDISFTDTLQRINIFD